MSIITSIWFARHQLPATSRRRALFRLMLMLRRDEQVRLRPPVTLPGPPRNVDADTAGAPTKTPFSSPPTPIPRVRENGDMGRRADRFDKAKAQTPEPGDGRDGAWSREQLERMDARFCRRLARAISRGLERASQG